MSKPNATTKDENKTILIHASVKKRLDGRKRHPRASYEEVIVELLDKTEDKKKGLF